ncbi:MAG TPA: hypothetical protein VII13_10910 [Vicinamibacteria bacterium]|jgi:hypothetical protein
MTGALRDGFRLLFRSKGVAVLLLAVNLGLAALLALPLAARLEKDLAHKEAASEMMYAFDHDWWSEWSDRQSGFTESFAPDIFGVGFAYKNLTLLLRGTLPAGLFAREADTDPENRVALDPLILGLGVAYLAAQAFLAGGVLGVLRAPQGSWTVRGFLHGSGFYFGRMLRITLATLTVAAVVFALWWPVAGWIEDRAVNAVSERTAMAWTVGRDLVLLLVLLAVSMASGYAKAITVLEERASAVLAWVSAASFCARHFLRAFGQVLAVAVMGAALLAVWAALDGAWVTTGYKTQLVTFLLAEALLLSRIGLRVALAGGQISLYRRLAPPL